MRKKITIILVLAVLFVGIPSVFAAGVQETSEDAFIDRFEEALANSNFTEEEVEDIIASANDLSWERTEGADAEVIVQALSLAREEQIDLDAEENAELALALARIAARLENEDYDESAVSKAVREAVRTQLQVIQEWKDSDRSENLGELLRSGVSNEARKAAQKQESGDADDMDDMDDMDDVDNQGNMDNMDDVDDQDDMDNMDNMDDTDDMDDSNRS